MEETKALGIEELSQEASSSTTPNLRMTLGRMSNNGLATIAGQVVEECNHDLRWPQCMDTYKAMMKDSTIASTVNLMAMDIAKVKWSVKVPEGYEKELSEKAKFIESCMGDMTHSWTEFIRQASSFNQYGFAPVEKVYRKRLRENGSKYNDGLYGLKELPLIAQDTVEGWTWESMGKELRGLYQERIKPSNFKSMTYSSPITDPKFIPRRKFMLFRSGHSKDSPIGVSPLNSVYIAWRYKTEYEKSEGIGVKYSPLY